MSNTISATEYLERYCGKPAKAKRDRISKLCFNNQPCSGRRDGDKVILVLPLPPTKNSEPRNIHEVGRMRSHWMTLVSVAWSEAGRPRFDSVTITPVFYLQQNNRDYDNCFGLAFKALQDGLRGNLVKDDNAKYLKLNAAQIVAGSGTPPRLELIITGGNENGNQDEC